MIKILLALCLTGVMSLSVNAFANDSYEEYVVSGWIDKEASEKLRNQFSKGPFASVSFNRSIGGTVGAGLAIALFLSQNNVDSIATGQCLSACTTAFLGGVSRKIDNLKGPVALHLHGAFDRDGVWNGPSSAKLGSFYVSKINRCVTKEQVQRYTEIRNKRGGLYLIASKAEVAYDIGLKTFKAFACEGTEALIPLDCKIAEDGVYFWRDILGKTCEVPERP